MRAPFQQWKANRNQDRKHPMMRRIIHDLTHALWGVSLANAAGAVMALLSRCISRSLTAMAMDFCRAVITLLLSDIEAPLLDVRFTPKSGHRLSLSGYLLCAKSGLMHCSN